MPFSSLFLSVFTIFHYIFHFITYLSVECLNVPNDNIRYAYPMRLLPPPYTHFKAFMLIHNKISFRKTDGSDGYHKDTISYTR